MVLPSELEQKKVEPPAQPLQHNLCLQVLLIDSIQFVLVIEDSVMSSLM